MLVTGHEDTGPILPETPLNYPGVLIATLPNHPIMTSHDMIILS